MHSFLKSASHSNVREHREGAARAAAVPSTAFPSGAIPQEQAPARDGIRARDKGAVLADVPLFFQLAKWQLLPHQAVQNPSLSPKA